MLEPAQYIYQARTRFIETFVPFFQEMYAAISGGKEQVKLQYISQLQTRNLEEAFRNTRSRDLILGWTSQGIHKDELEMLITDNGETYPLKRVASQGQQKTFLLAMKLAQAVYLTSNSPQADPILLLDDIFDKLDSERVERIVRLVQSDRFGQIFITDTDRQHLTSIVQPDASAKIFYVENGQITQ
jgi:DNA replication and repair protein RecF